MNHKEMLQDIQKEVMKEGDVIIKIEGKERMGMSSTLFKLVSQIKDKEKNGIK